MSSVVPMIAYENGNAAMDWLIEAFGFVEADRRLVGRRTPHARRARGGRRTHHAGDSDA